MEKIIDTGGLAFPCPASKCENIQGDSYNVTEGQEGMTIRDYFATRAFERFVQAHIDHSVDDLSKEDIAREAYSYADYMIAERDKK